MSATVNSGVCNFAGFTITTSTWTPIIVPLECCYFAFWNNSDSMILSPDVTGPEIYSITLVQGASQMVTATYIQSNFRFNTGDILFFAMGISQASSTAFLSTVKR